ncbi:MAG TPA: response regulator [Polyangiaceae bacterium]|nr:response regulator [Polyangiaceae bacterium]
MQSPPANLRGLEIVVVDDEPDARELVACALEHCGAHVRMAGDAGAARALLATQLPDVIISDIAMPDEDGYDLIRSVRSSLPANDRHLAAIALTASASRSDQLRSLSAGFDVHIGKPVNPWDLARAVRELVLERVPDVAARIG